MRRTLTGILSSFALAVVMLTAPGAVPTAAAYQTGSSAVGTINGSYRPSPYRDYSGNFHPISGGRCVRVQRLLGNGTWTSAYVTSGGSGSSATSCNSGNWTFWQITNDNAVSGTYGIRLYLYFDPTGAYEGRTVRWCGDGTPSTASKNQCLARR